MPEPGTIVLSEGTIRGGTLNGSDFYEKSSLIAYLYKCASDPRQDPLVADAFRALAESLEKGGH